MICKKCGANIEDASKFCGYCGVQVNNTSDTQIPVQNIEQPVVNVEEINNTSLEPINREEQVIQPVLENVQIQSQEPIEQVSTNGTNNNEQKSTKKKNEKMIFIILGVVLAVIAVVLVILAFNKTANSPIATLEKALEKFEDVESGTINVKLEMLSTTSDSMNLSATGKFAENNDNYDIALTVNKSMLTDEISLYSRANERELKLFVQSQIVDMLGFTSSDTNTWLNYTVNLSELGIDDIDENDDTDLNLGKILDSKHFKYIDTQNNLKHYELVIDESLINKIEAEAKREGLDESLNDIENTIDLTESIVVDFYIDKSNNLVRISIDLADYIEEADFSSVLLSIEFSSLNNTKVIIPSEALNSDMNLEAYMELNSSLEGTYEDDYTDNCIDGVNCILN